MQKQYDFSMFNDDKQPTAKPSKQQLDFSMFEQNPVEKDGRGNDVAIEEMHPAIGTLDRMAVKNLGNSTESSIKYLKQKHPNLEIQVDPRDDQRFLIRDPQKDQQWRRLDPDTGFFSSDFLRDAGDVAYDIGSGVAEGAATALAGIGSGGAAAIPAAALTGGATEELRQHAGKWLGVNENINEDEVLQAAAISGTIPMVGKGLRKGGGNIARSIGKKYPALMSKLSGIKQDVIENLNLDKKRFGDIDESVGDYARGLRDDVQDTIRTQRRVRGSEMEDQLRKAGDVDMRPTKETLQRQIAEREEQLAKQFDPITYDELQQLKQMDDDIFRRTVGEATHEAPDTVSAVQAKKYSQRMKDYGNVDKDKVHQSAVQRKVDTVDKEQMAVARELGSGIEDRIKTQMDDPGTYDRYKEFLRNAEQMKRMNNNNDKSIIQFMKGTRKNGDDFTPTEIEAMKENFDTISSWARQQGKTGDVADMNGASRVLESREIFNNPTLGDAISFQQGKTPASVIGGGLGGALGFGATRSYYGGLVGAGAGALGGNFVASPWAIKKTMEAAPKMMNATSKTLDKYGNTGYGVMKSAWELQRERDAEQKKRTHTGF